MHSEPTLWKENFKMQLRGKECWREKSPWGLRKSPKNFDIPATVNPVEEDAVNFLRPVGLNRGVTDPRITWNEWFTLCFGEHTIFSFLSTGNPCPTLSLYLQFRSDFQSHYTA